MFVYLKETELHKKLFINKNYKQNTVKLVFDKNTPVHEVADDALAGAIVASFPKFLESSKDKPTFSVKKKEPKAAEPIPAPTSVEEVKEENFVEPVAPVEEVKEETPVEEVKEVKKPGRRRKNLR